MRQAYTLYCGTEQLDPLCAGSAVRLRRSGQAVLNAMGEELGRGPFLRRYSGAKREEGSLQACSFWLAEALAELGPQDEVEEVFFRTIRGLSRGVGILGEMVDPLSGDFLGNTPRGLSHLALIHAACPIGGDRVWHVRSSG